ncbi:MAG: DUF1801 domain-containing protein [Gemmatimonadota bacterium]|nr:DUF1801 domain-containing protein [Gemmatimonadota bacterium]MDH3428114.1 DUF1801 domain-containing protein [Gemmatimonadota bacterium]
MAENKTKPTTASVADFLASVENETRRRDAQIVCDVMQEITGERPRMWGDTMVGFGTYGYKYASGRAGNWFLTGFAPRKANLVLYIMSGFTGHAALMKKLGKHKTGSSCLYINKLDDVDMEVLRELVRRSVEHVSNAST